MSKISDVRDFLLKQLSELADSEATAEEMALKIERAKATSMVAGTFINAVKVEIDAIRLLDDTGRLPVAVDAGDVLPVGGRELRVLSGGR